MAMKTYIDQLKVEAEAANLRREEVKAKFQNADSRVLCDTPLTDQITALMASLPPAQRNRPWSMDELVVRLSGRYSAKPHAMNVGTALRQLGWVTRRDWSAEGAGRRVWRRYE
ncbi:MAG TPA: hypothetical protein DCY55_01280 [Gammaproteobacteria bacterium]|nr:hypothetical protein [Gammaproteobacteria bacterium]